MEKQRYHDMDWLRVGAFFLLMLYHCGMIFVGWDFHIMNPQVLEEIQPPMIFLNQWRLPLLFAISGAGTWFALRRRTLSQFAGERTLRLFLPLCFGMIFIIPPQIYVEYRMKGVVDPGYWDFQLDVLKFVPYPDGGMFSWHHLWFVVYLFVFSLAAVPLFKYLRSDSGERKLTALRTWLAGSPWRLMAMATPMAAVYLSMDWRWGETHGLIDDPAALTRYFTVFLLGFVVMGNVDIRQQAVQSRKIFLIALALVFVPQRWMVYNLSQGHWSFYVFYQIFKSCYCWFMILTLVGYSAKYLTRGNRFLTYANEAVYPYYILHQSVMLVLAYWIVPLSWNPLAKFVVILLGMFGISGLIYEGLIRRFSLIRPLFGLRIKPPKPKLESTHSSTSLESA